MLQASDLRFHYRRNTPILDGVSIQILPGEVVGLVGPSGSGKSTLLYVLGLLLNPQGGSITLNGVDATELSDNSRSRLRAHHIGFVFQDACLDLSRTILDNVLESATYNGLNRALAIPQAIDLLSELGVAVDPARRPGEISGGQAQRVALARALIHRPSVILADEPTGNLDSASAGVVLNQLVDRSRAGAAVAIATHDPRVVERCDRMVAL